jgi:ABC-type polysaccharide/polyol phosphate transport system ATPase subunit
MTSSNPTAAAGAVDAPVALEGPQAYRAPSRDAPIAIEVRDVSKTFRIPEHRVDTLKERIVNPMSRGSYRELRALQNISFDVRRGEFFGIVGRNGSGKSTLLKVLASIYRPDAGRVRMAGRMAPFIELGVGFNPELTARENIVLNGVLFGLSRRKASTMTDAVLDFAELREFIDLKIKNYSSGMMVRLAFAIMVQADADIMLIDEVLAVGDASFGQKCMDIFYQRRAAGKTIVLVTHDMATVQAMCHRAVLLHDGEMRYQGDADKAASKYLQLNFAGADAEVIDPTAPPSDETDATAEFNARLLHARLVGVDGESISTLEQGTPLVLDAAIEAARELTEPILLFYVRNADGVVVFAVKRRIEHVVTSGERIRLGGEIENRLVPGTYQLECWIGQYHASGAAGVQPMRLLKFVVYGTGGTQGIVTVEADLNPIVEPGTAS